MSEIGQYQKIKTMFQTLKGRGYSINSIATEMGIPRTWLYETLRDGNNEASYARMDELYKYMRAEVRKTSRGK